MVNFKAQWAHDHPWSSMILRQGRAKVSPWKKRETWTFAQQLQTLLQLSQELDSVIRMWVENLPGFFRGPPYWRRSLPILDTLQTNKFFAGERRYSH